MTRSTIDESNWVFLASHRLNCGRSNIVRTFGLLRLTFKRANLLSQ
jgi:hypothetical protein